MWNVLIYPAFLSPLRNVPGPKNNHPLIGQTLRFIQQTEGPNELYLKWVHQWPNTPFIRYLSVANSEVLVVNNLKAYKEVLQAKCYSFAKPMFFRRLIGEITGVGLLFKEGEEHRNQRRLLQGPFSFANIKSLLPLFHAGATRLTSTIHSIISSDPQNTIIDVSFLLSKTTLDIIGVTALGVELDNISSNPMLSFHECYRRIFEQPAIGNVISVINMYIPLRSWLPLKANRDFVTANQEVRRLLRNIVGQRRKEINSGQYNGSGRDLLTFMMQVRLPNGGKSPWSDEDILDHLLTFVAAGHETTSGALIWAIYALAVHEGVQDQLYAEIQALTEGRQPGWTPTYEEIEGLKYLNNFTFEVLRRYSPTIFAPREAAVDMVIQGVSIPKGTSVVISIHAANHHPEIWGADAMEFRPQRWEELVHGRDPGADPYGLETFLQGPKICIGKSFALLEFKVILIELMRSFVFEWPLETKSLGLVNTFVLKPKGGMNVRIKARN